MGDRFLPEPDMEQLAFAARKYLYEGDANQAATHPIDHVAWCEIADLDPVLWTGWVEHYGEPFLKWFGEALQPTPLELYAMDALWFRSWRAQLTNDRVSAAHLKTWGEMRGHFDERPPPPPVRHLSSDEALAEVIALKPEVLMYALEKALDIEALRRGQTPEPTPGAKGAEHHGQEKEQEKDQEE